MRDNIKATTITFDTLGEHGSLFAQMFRVRKLVFIDGMGWDLPTALDMEFDQYDTPFSSWVVVYRGEDILAGVRLTPSTSRVMAASYMLRDAQMGLLEGFPSDVLTETAPVSTDVWEASRVFVRADGESPSVCLAIRDMLLREMVRTASARGVSRILCILPTWWPRLSRSGLSVRAAGPVFELGGLQQAVDIDVARSFGFEIPDRVA
jgi:N-acyl-L-homoserine lactone synthetase